MSDCVGAESDEDDALTGDQIIDQVWGLAAMSPKALLRWFDAEAESSSPVELEKAHLLVTSHPSLPGDYYAHSAARRARDWPLPCYWLSWLGLAERLQSHICQLQGGRRAMLDDLCLLLDKKELVHFRAGFGMPAWRRPTLESSFWSEQWWSGQAWQSSSSSPSFWAGQ